MQKSFPRQPWFPLPFFGLALYSQLGWNIFGTADYPFKLLIPEWIPAIQGTLLLAPYVVWVRMRTSILVSKNRY